MRDDHLLRPTSASAGPFSASAVGSCWDSDSSEKYPFFSDSVKSFSTYCHIDIISEIETKLSHLAFYRWHSKILRYDRFDEIESLLNPNSYFNEWIGSADAALKAWNPTVNSAITNVKTPAMTKGMMPMSIR